MAEVVPLVGAGVLLCISDLADTMRQYERHKSIQAEIKFRIT